MLLDAVKNTPLLRPNALPISGNICIVCFREAFTHINDVLLKRAKAIFIIGANADQLTEMNDYIANVESGVKQKILVLPFAEISSYNDSIFVFFHNDLQYHQIAHCWEHMRKFGYESFYTFMPFPSTREGIAFTHIPEYYEDNKENLEQTYSLLSDEESKLILAARVRTILSGAVGYLKVSKYKEYFHPFVKPEPGDIILDGGVSEYIGQQIQFIKAIGQNGRYIGFEPDPVGFCSAYEAFKKSSPYTNYELMPFGLWHKQDKLRFQIQGQGTHITKSENETSIECEVLPLDEFVKTNNLNKVDFIKLDVEGAELNALKGAMKTITKFRPKLAISLYHQMQDLYFIPLFLSEICKDYEFYLGHHHATLHETILYAKPQV